MPYYIGMTQGTDLFEREFTVDDYLRVGEEMWTWLHLHPSRSKEEWPGLSAYEIFCSDCPLCDLAIIRLVRRQGAKHHRATEYCNYCAINWGIPKDEVLHYCLHSKAAYSKWRESMAGSEDAAFYAGIIALAIAKERARLAKKRGRR